MRKFTAIAAILPLLAIFSAHAQDNDAPVFVPPTKPNTNAYRSLWEKSPFTEKEVVLPPEDPSFAEGLKLEGVMTLDGQDVACLSDINTEEIIYVRGDEPTRGITLVEIRNRDQVDGMQVILSSGLQRATVGFEEDNLIVTPNAAAGAQPKTSSKKGSSSNNQQQKQASQKPAAQEQSSLTEEQMRERRRQFWESMRDRRSRGGS